MQKFLVKNKIWITTIATAIFVAIVLVGGFLVWRWRAPKAMAPASSTTQTTATTPAPALNPLQIEAIKARSYPGSIISLEQQLNNQTSIVSYMSDGYKIFALLTTPTGSAPTGGWPVVILNHGYINPSAYRTNDGSYSGITNALTSNGVAVIKPDYRGHGSSQGTPEGGHFSPVYTYDDLNLISSITQTPALNLNANRLGTLGHSLGAHTSLRVAVVNPNIKATAYLSGVVGSVEDILYNWPNSPMPSDLPAVVQQNREALLAQYGTPKTNPEFWDSVSAINYVSSITGPSQIHHSLSDSTVPVSFSIKLRDALQAAGKPVQYYEYPGDDHQLSSNTVQVNTRLVEFFKASL